MRLLRKHGKNHLNNNLMIRSLIISLLIGLSVNMTTAQATGLKSNSLAEKDTAIVKVYLPAEIAIIKSSSLNGNWKDSYEKAIIVNPAADSKEVEALTKILSNNNSGYTPENTVIICAERNNNAITEVAQGYFVARLVAERLFNNDIVFGDIRPLTSEETDIHGKDYNFKFTKNK